MSEETKGKAKEAGGAQAVAAYILAHAQGFTSKDLCEATGINPANLARYRNSGVVKAAIASTGLSYVAGKGRSPSTFIQWSPAAEAA